MKRRRALKVLLASTVVVVAAAWFEVSRLGLLSAHARYLAQVAAAKKEGLPFSKDDIGLPSVPDDQNAAQILLNAQTEVQSLPGHPDTVLLDWGSTYAKVPVMDAQVDRALLDLKPVFEMTDEAAKRPHLDFHWAWHAMDDDMTGLNAVTQLTKMLVIRSRRAAQKGDIKAALQALQTTALLSGQLGENPNIWSFDQRLSCENRTLNAAMDVLRKDRSPATIASLRNVIVDLRSPPNLRAAARAQFALTQGSVGRMAYAEERDTTPCGKYDCDFYPPEWKLMKIPQIAEVNRANQIERYRTIFAALPADVNLLNRAEPAAKRIEVKWNDESGLGFMAADMYCLPYSGAIDNVLEAVARRRVLSAALDILSLPSLPSTWSKKGPEGIDPTMDRPLTYKRTRDGFVVYSYGKDRKDDKGLPRTYTRDYYAYDISFEYPKLSVKVDPKPAAPRITKVSPSDGD